MKIDLHELIKKAIYVVIGLILFLLLIVGVLTSDFNKIQKFDSEDMSARAMISSVNKSSKNRYYNTEISVDSSIKMANLGDFTFNIGQKKMLVTNISLKYKSYHSDEWMNGGEKIKEEIIKKSAILRDAVIDAMIDNYEVSLNQKEMKRHIQKNVNRKLSEGEIEEVYFNKFIFQ